LTPQTQIAVPQGFNWHCSFILIEAGVHARRLDVNMNCRWGEGRWGEGDTLGVAVVVDLVQCGHPTPSFDALQHRGGEHTLGDVLSLEVTADKETHFSTFAAPAHIAKNDRSHYVNVYVPEREIYFKCHISWWEHSSHFRLIGRGVLSVSVVSQLVYEFLCLTSPKEKPQVPI